MPLILLYFFLFINAFSALGQEKGVLRGKMTGASGEKVEFASIVVIGQSLGTTTDSSGNYFLALPEGSYKIKFSCIGSKNIFLPFIISLIFNKKYANY